MLNHVIQFKNWSIITIISSVISTSSKNVDKYCQRAWNLPVIQWSKTRYSLQVNGYCIVFKQSYSFS